MGNQSEKEHMYEEFMRLRNRVVLCLTDEGKGLSLLFKMGVLVQILAIYFSESKQQVSSTCNPQEEALRILDQGPQFCGEFFREMGLEFVRISQSSKETP